MNSEKRKLYNNILKIALPVTLQALLQASFSVVDQIMIGYLGGQSIAAVGLAGKFISIYTVLLGAITAAAGIKLTLDNDTFENTGKSRFFERRTSRVLY